MAKRKAPMDQDRYSLSPYSKFLMAWVSFLGADEDHRLTDGGDTAEDKFVDWMRSSFDDHGDNPKSNRTDEQRHESIVQRVRSINNRRTKPKPTYKKINQGGKYVYAYDKNGNKIVTKPADAVKPAYPTPFLDKDNETLDEAMATADAAFAQFMT